MSSAHFAGLRVFPIWVDAPSVTRLDWKPGAVRVAEREGSPVTEELVVTNSSMEALVMLEASLRSRWQGILDAAALEVGGDAGLSRQVRSKRGDLKASGIVTSSTDDFDRIIHLAAFDESRPTPGERMNKARNALTMDGAE